MLSRYSVTKIAWLQCIHLTNVPHWLPICKSVIIPCRGRFPGHAKADPPYLHMFESNHRKYGR
jgi:hypothetical protein